MTPKWVLTLTLGLVVCILSISKTGSADERRWRSYEGMVSVEDYDDAIKGKKDDEYQDARRPCKRQSSIWDSDGPLMPCLRALLTTVMDGTLVFPEECCKVPFLNIFCGFLPKKRSERNLVRQIVTCSKAAMTNLREGRYVFPEECCEVPIVGFVFCQKFRRGPVLTLPPLKLNATLSLGPLW